MKREERTVEKDRRETKSRRGQREKRERPSPAPFSTMIRNPIFWRSLIFSGVMATRLSLANVSFGTPIVKSFT